MPQATPTPDLIAAEDRAADLEERAERAASVIRARLRRNHFADGIAWAWGQAPPRHRQGKV